MGFHRDICREHGLIGRRNCLMIEAANSLSATASPKLSITCSFALGHGRTRLGSGLRAVASRCLSRENAGRTMTVLHHALCGDGFDQNPGFNNIHGDMFKVLFWFCGRCNTAGFASRHVSFPGIGSHSIANIVPNSESSNSGGTRSDNPPSYRIGCMSNDYTVRYTRVS